MVIVQSLCNWRNQRAPWLRIDRFDILIGDMQHLMSPIFVTKFGHDKKETSRSYRRRY